MRKKILLTRGIGNERDTQALQNLGIDTVSESFTQITAGQESDAHELLALAESFTAWVVITSINAIDFWGELVGVCELKKVFDSNSQLNFAAVGESSAAALRAYGQTEIKIPVIPSAEGLLDLLLKESSSSALIPTGNLARKVIPYGLREAGWNVETRVVYKNDPVTTAPRSIRALERDEFDGILLRSPSAVRALISFLPKPNTAIFCGGTTTADQARELGLTVTGVTDNPTPEGIAKMISEKLKGSQ